MPKRLRIGLTGGIASGKSEVSRRFRELGIAVIDADEAARAVVEPGTPGLHAVLDTFGKQLLTAAGTLDRQTLRDLVFSDPVKRRELERLLHPLIRAHMESLAARADGSYIVMAIPLLVEVNGRDRVDRVLVVDVDEKIQRARLMGRDGASAAQADSIMAAQANRMTRVAAADDVVVNSGTLDELRSAVDELHRRYLDLSATMTL